MERKASWTKQDLESLYGQPESGRLEYKQSATLQDAKGGADKVKAELTKQVSAFANSEGGLLIIGMREAREGKTRVAEGLDEGVDPQAIGREWLQNLVEGGVSPYLPGIRFFAVPLTETPGGHVAFVIDVPKGSTAYQASDKLYYGRSEYESKALPDHEIRLRMSRGRTAQAQLVVQELQLTNRSAQLLDFGCLLGHSSFASGSRCLTGISPCLLPQNVIRSSPV